MGLKDRAAKLINRKEKKTPKEPRADPDPNDKLTFEQSPQADSLHKDSEMHLHNNHNPGPGNSGSKQNIVQDYPQPCSKETSRPMGSEDLKSHGLQSHRPHGKALETLQMHDSLPNKTHAMDKSHRQAGDLYTGLASPGYAAPQVPPSVPRGPVQQLTDAQQYAYRGYVGQQQVHTYVHPSVPPQQLPHGIYPRYPNSSARPAFRAQQGYPPDYTSSQSFPSLNSVRQPSGPDSFQHRTAANQTQPKQSSLQRSDYTEQITQHRPQTGLPRKSHSEPSPGRPPYVTDPTIVSSETPRNEHTDQFNATQQGNYLNEHKPEQHMSEPQSDKSGHQFAEHVSLEHSSEQTGASCANDPKRRSEISALTLVGNPGAGKSTILNGVAGKVVFAAGISIGSGLTTSLNEYYHNGFSLFDTPGLADVERKKQAGQELNKLLSKPVPLRIAFVVTLERGRVRPEDALTIELVLDSIKTETDDMFGVIINRVTERVRKEMDASPEKEAKIRRSLTGKHRTCYWCYVGMNRDLEDESNRKLMTPELEFFFSSLPETKPEDTRTVPIDTDSIEEKLKKHMEVIQDIETANEEELRRMTKDLMMQKEKYAAQEALLVRDEQNLVKEIQRAKAEAAATRAAAERAERESRRRLKHHGRHQGTYHEHPEDLEIYDPEYPGRGYTSRTSAQGVPAQHADHHLMSGRQSDNDDGTRARREIGQIQSRCAHGNSDVPIVDRISEEPDFRYGHRNIDGQRGQGTGGSSHRPGNHRSSRDLGVDNRMVNNKKPTKNSGSMNIWQDHRTS